MSKNSKALLVIVLLVITIGGVGAGVYLVQKNQELRKKAAVPTGVATILLSPPSASYVVGDPFLVNILFNTSGNTISFISARVKYPFTGSTPEITASDIQINPQLISGGWSCPIKQIAIEGNEVNVDVSCLTTGAGLTTTTNTSLATFTLQAASVPTINPIVVSFDATKSLITKKAGFGEETEDILLTPSSTGTYTILAAEAGGGGGVTSTPTPTTVSQTSTPSPTLASGVSPTSTPTSTLTPTTAAGLGGLESTPTPTNRPTSVATKTPTPTTSSTSSSGESDTTTQLPDSGVPLPFIFLTGLGVLVLVFAALLVI